MQKSIIVKIGDTPYEFGYPNVGQKLEIESFKLVFSLGAYGEMARSGHQTARELLDLIDSCSYFKSLSEKFSKDFDVLNFSKIDFETSLKLRKAFKEYATWYKEFENELYKNLENDGQPTE